MTFRSFIILIIILSSCSGSPQEIKESHLAKVLINSHDVELPEGFVHKKYYTGDVIAEVADPIVAINNLIIDTVKFKEKGTYFVKLLAATSNYKLDHFRQVDLIIKPLKQQNSTSSQEVSCMVDQQRATKWHHFDQTPIQILDSGLFEVSIRVLPEEKSKVYIDQILFVNEVNYQPEGYEYEIDTQQLHLPPSWAFGVIYGSYANQENTNAIVNQLIDGGFPIDGFWTDSWFWNHYNKGDGPDGYLDFIGDTSAFPHMEQMWSNMEKHKIQSGIWVWDAIQSNGNEEVFEEFLEKGYFREEPKENTDGWHNRIKNTLIGNIDFSNPEAVAAWKKHLSPIFEKGVDFLKLDRSSSIDFLKANYELTQAYTSVENGRGFVMSHLHSTFDPRAKLYPIKWTGDAMIAWNQADYPNMGNYSMGGLKQNIQMVADPNKTTYENVFLANDIGGYSYFGCNDFSDELYMRWVQFGMLAPFSTVFSTADNPSGNLPFNFSNEAQDNFRFYANLKQSLFPFIYTYAHRAIQTGKKIRIGDGKHDTQYLMGETFLVAPIYENGARARKIFFPKGEWINFYNEKEVYKTGTVEVKAPLNQMPLFVKKGSIVPMRKSTLNILSGNNDILEWHVYPDAQGDFTLIEDDGISNAYLTQEIATTKLTYDFNDAKKLIVKISPTTGNYKGMSQARKNELYIHLEANPSSILYQGQETPFEKTNKYDAETIMVSLPEIDKKKEQIITVNF